MFLVRKERKMSRVSEIIDQSGVRESADTYTTYTTYASLTKSRDNITKQTKQVLNQEIDRPKHYASKSGKDVIDWCEDFGIMGNAYVFNIFKYLCRAGKKDNNSELQDALKAEVYLKRYIESLKNS